MGTLRGVSTALVLTACGAELPSPSSIQGPRVIALETATPEVRSGDEAQVRARWFDPAGRAAVMLWRACWEGAGVDPLRCADGATGRDLVGAGDEVTLPSDLTRERSAGTLLVVFRLAVGNERLEAFRRIVVGDGAAPNLPPPIAAVTLVEGAVRTEVPDGALIEVGGGPVVVEVTTAVGAGEPLPDGGRETLTLSLLTSSGSFDPPRRVGEGALRASWVGASPGDARMWAVLRDDRAGVTTRAWTVRRAR